MLPLNINLHIAFHSGAIIRGAESGAARGSVVVIDYLQLLDQRRESPALQDQVAELRQFARGRGCILVFLSQISRAIEERQERRPTLADIHLPNPVRLESFNKICFLYRDPVDPTRAEVALHRPKLHRFVASWDPAAARFS